MWGDKSVPTYQSESLGARKKENAGSAISSAIGGFSSLAKRLKGKSGSEGPSTGQYNSGDAATITSGDGE